MWVLYFIVQFYVFTILVGVEGGYLFYLAQSLISQKYDCLKWMFVFRKDVHLVFRNTGAIYFMHSVIIYKSLFCLFVSLGFSGIELCHPETLLLLPS